jgi:hypothetical protein
VFDISVPRLLEWALNCNGLRLSGLGREIIGNFGSDCLRLQSAPGSQ